MDRIEILNQGIKTFFERQIREPTDAQSNNISALAYPVRRMVLNRIAGKYKKKIDINTQKRFYAGKLMHDTFKHTILHTIPEITVQSTELPVDDKRAEIRGYIDVSLGIDGRSYPSEIKSMMYLKSITNPKEFLTSKEMFYQCYYHALNFYLFCSNKPEGQFILSDFAFNYILLPMALDYEEAARIEEKCISGVNPLVHEWDGKDFQPEDVQYLPDCEDCDSYCQFQVLCGRVDAPVDMRDVDLERVDYLASRKLELEEGAKEYDDIKEELKTLTRGHETVITLNYMLQGKEMAGRTIYNVPDEVKKQYTTDKGKPYWQITKILSLEGRKEEVK